MNTVLPFVNGRTVLFNQSDKDGFTGGAQIGYNWQLTPGSGFVIGVEADAQYLDFGGRRQNGITFNGGPGTIAGTFRLSAQQAKDLRTGKLYIQINSEKAPPGYSWGPKGTLWGWIFPAHETVGANVPQQGHWFIPQLDTPSR